MTIGGDRPPRLGGDVVTFEDIREFLVAYLEYEQQMHITNQDGGDRVLARRQELADSATQMMVADEFYDGKLWVDLSEEELGQGLKRFAGVDMQQTGDEQFRRQIFRVLKMDANVPIDSRVFMQKRALRKYLADSGLTEVVRPGGRQYTIKHGKVLVEVIEAGIEPLEFRRTVEKKMRFDFVTHDPDALFSIIAKQQRDQAVIEANGAVRRQTTIACVDAVWVISGCPCRASTRSSDIAVMPEPESISTLSSAAAEAPGTSRRPATCCVRASECRSVSTVSTLVSPLPHGCKTETRALEMELELPHDCRDAGAGSCIGRE